MRGVENDAGGGADVRDYERAGGGEERPLSVIECAGHRAVVRDPERGGRAERDAPGVDEIGIGLRGESVDVGDEVRDLIGSRGNDEDGRGYGRRRGFVELDGSRVDVVAGVGAIAVRGVAGGVQGHGSGARGGRHPIEFERYPGLGAGAGADGGVLNKLNFTRLASAEAAAVAADLRVAVGGREIAAAAVLQIAVEAGG